MKLLITTDFLTRWDGISRFLQEVIPILKKDFKITLVCPEYSKLKIPGIKIVKIPLKKRFFKGYPVPKFQYGTIKKLVKETDVVFAQTLGPICLSAYRSARKLKKPITGFVHIIDWEIFAETMGRNPFRNLVKSISIYFTKFIYNRYNSLIVPSTGIADLLIINGIKVKKRIAKLGVDLKKFKPGKNNKLRKELGFKPEDIVIGQHGRISIEKDHTTLLRAFARVRAKLKNVKLLIVGDGYEKIRKKFLKQPGVVLLESKEDIEQYLQAIDIYCLTSLTETTSLTTLEAMSCGLPVVVTDAGLIRDYVIDEYNGLFTTKKDTVELYQKLLRLAQDEELRERLGRHARETIKEEYNWKITARKVSGALKELVL